MSTLLQTGILFVVNQNTTGLPEKATVSNKRYSGYVCRQHEKTHATSINIIKKKNKGLKTRQNPLPIGILIAGKFQELLLNSMACSNKTLKRGDAGSF